MLIDSDMRTGKSFLAAKYAVESLTLGKYKTAVFVSLKQLQSTQQKQDVDRVADELGSRVRMVDYRSVQTKKITAQLATVCVNSIHRVE